LTPQIPALFSTATTSPSAFSGYDGFSQIGPASLPYGSLHLADTCIFQSQRDIEGQERNATASFVPYSVENDFYAQSAMISMRSNDLAMSQDIRNIRDMTQAHRTSFGQNPQLHLPLDAAKFLSETFVSVSEEPTSSNPNFTRSQIQYSHPAQASAVGKRKHKAITNGSNGMSLIVAKKRRRYANNTEREATAQVREMGACIRCRLQHNQVRLQAYTLE